ncbi:O-antigen ligase family protein [Limnohabitans sp.]|uniref:O-antigen ligase family protein n=1 Tax=Limnohabitans sp. TaxID=1907725 RepID=UPI002AFFCA2C|nr:O-antigen ligase family protein [Limnohabitans sp.]
MPILSFLSRPSSWVLLFVFTCQLIFTSPELILVGMALMGSVLFFRDHKRSLVVDWTGSDARALWLVPIGFASVFWIKLLSASWALDSQQAIDNAFNSIHFLLWPALVLFFRKANVSVRQTESWAAASMIVLMIWYLVARLFFPSSVDAQCFKAGAHDCGLLGQTMAFMLLWLFIAMTRPDIQKTEKVYLISALVAGWLAFLGTLRRTELLGLLLGMSVVLLWRFKKSFSLKKATISLGLCVLLMMMAWPVVNPRFSIVAHEVGLYLEGGVARVQALNTSVGGRLEMYRIALEAIQERPWFGWGAGLKPIHVPQFATDPSNPYGYSNFHQQYLQVVLEVGALGATLALVLFVYLIRRMVAIPWQQGHKELSAILAALFFTYAWKALANGALLYSVTNSVFVFFSALIWAELLKFSTQLPQAAEVNR